MNKIEVLRVPDERIGRTYWKPEHDGDLAIVVLHESGDRAVVAIVEKQYHPALLAALLEDAGAVKWHTIGMQCEDEVCEGHLIIPMDDPGLYWLLPVPEDTTDE